MALFKKYSWSVFIFLLMGCSTTANLYPIEGPYSAIKPTPVLKAKVYGILGNSGKITLLTPDGENCEGKWSVIAPQQVSSTFGTAAVTSGLSSATGSVSGTTLSNVPGTNNGQAMLVCDQGTTMEVEFNTGSGTANGFGIARDSKDNKYKVLF